MHNHLPIMANAYIPDIELLQLMRSDDPKASESAFIQLSNDPSVQACIEEILAESGIKNVSVAFLKERAFQSLRDQAKKGKLETASLANAYVQYWENLLRVQPILTGEKPHYEDTLKTLFTAPSLVNFIQGKVSNAKLLNSSKEKIEENSKHILHEGIFRMIQEIKKGNFRGDSTLKTFLTAICKNVFFDLVKKQDIALTELNENLKAEEDESNALAQEEADFIEAEYVKWEEKVLNDIKPDCREILILAFKEKRSNDEIALKMGLALQTVKNKKNGDCKDQLDKAVAKPPKLWAFLTENFNIKKRKKS
jgi:RNA polymerase sigma factor (sigma-70 family)